MLQTYAYPVILEPADTPGIVVVTFPDVQEAITEGDGEAHALEQAAEALGLTLLTYLQLGRPLPVPSAEKDRPTVTPKPEDAAKIAVIEAFASSGLTKSDLARLIGRDEKEVRRILDPRHATKLPILAKTLTALGRRLVVGVERAA